MAKVVTSTKAPKSIACPVVSEQKISPLVLITIVTVPLTITTPGAGAVKATERTTVAALVKRGLPGFVWKYVAL